MTDDQQESPPQDLPETPEPPAASTATAIALEDEPDIKINGISAELFADPWGDDDLDIGLKSAIFVG